MLVGSWKWSAGLEAVLLQDTSITFGSPTCYVTTLTSVYEFFCGKMNVWKALCTWTIIGHIKLLSENSLSSWTASREATALSGSPVVGARCVLVSYVCSDIEDFIFCQFWRPHVWTQGMGKTVVQTSEDSRGESAASGASQKSMACLGQALHCSSLPLLSHDLYCCVCLYVADLFERSYSVWKFILSRCCSKQIAVTWRLRWLVFLWHWKTCFLLARRY